MKRIALEMFTVMAVGAIGYGAIEVLVRGHSHITMALLGGISMIAIHILGDDRRNGASLIVLLTMSAIFITSCEFLAGEILNVGLKMHIWSYCKTCGAADSSRQGSRDAGWRCRAQCAGRA